MLYLSISLCIQKYIKSYSHGIVEIITYDKLHILTLMTTTGEQYCSHQDMQPYGVECIRQVCNVHHHHVCLPVLARTTPLFNITFSKRSKSISDSRTLSVMVLNTKCGYKVFSKLYSNSFSTSALQT